MRARSQHLLDTLIALMCRCLYPAASVTTVLSRNAYARQPHFSHVLSPISPTPTDELNVLLKTQPLYSFRSPEEIRKAFEDANVDVDSPLPITTTCGSGVTAAVLTLALELAGRKAELSPVYDGSWSEWGSRADLPKSVGADP